MDTNIDTKHIYTKLLSCVCVCWRERVVTKPVAPLCKTSFSARFMAPLMDTGLSGGGETARVCVYVLVFYVCAVMGIR